MKQEHEHSLDKQEDKLPQLQFINKPKSIQSNNSNIIVMDTLIDNSQLMTNSNLNIKKKLVPIKIKRKP